MRSTYSRLLYIKDGHDVGILFSTDESAPEKPPSVTAEHVDLRSRLESRREEGLGLLCQQDGAMALYGATWQGTAFLAAMGNAYKFASVLDDNPIYSGCALYAGQQRVPICSPASAALDSISTVFITAFSHEQAMLAKLRSLGFPGRVVMVTPQFAYLN